MLTFLKNKLLYKKWLNFTLLFGIFLMITLLVALPLYRETALYKLLQQTMNEAVVTYNANPMRIDTEYAFSFGESHTPSSYIEKKAKERHDNLVKGIPVTTNKQVLLTEVVVENYTFEAMPTEFRNSNKNLSVANLSDMENHVNMVYGTYPAYGENADGQYECMVSTKFFIDNKLYLGQLISTDKFAKDGKPTRYLKIVGVFEESDIHDDYWVMAPSAYDKQLFVTMKTIDALQQDYLKIGGVLDCYVKHYIFCDYTKLRDGDLRLIQKKMERYFNTQSGDGKTVYHSNFLTVAKGYVAEANRLIALVYVLQIPIILMLITFIFMVATELIGNELNEIAMLLSRGVSKKQILGVYALQSLILACIATIFAIPASYGLVYLLSHASAFLQFQFGDGYGVVGTPDIFLFAIIGVLLSVLFVVMSSLPFLKTTIVQHKSKRNRADKPFMQRYFIDIILLALSSYLLYSFNSQKDAIATAIINGENLDPVVYISSTLFMIGFGIVVLRIATLLKKGIYFLGKNRWKPSSYAAFLQMIRTEKKQSFISIFLVMTIAMGIFNANMANTIHINEQEKMTYQFGADYVIREKWESRPGAEMYTTYLKEPDLTKYDKVFEQVESHTFVYTEDNAILNLSTGNQEHVRLMGITPKAFGETANMLDGITSEHWYHALNALSNTAKGVLISKSLADAQELKVGDSIKYSRLDSDGNRMNNVVRTVAGIIEAFPSYAGYAEIPDVDAKAEEEEKEKAPLKTIEQYLIVDTFRQMTNDFGTTQYEIWMKTGDQADVVTGFLEENQINCEYKIDTQNEIHTTLTSSLIQITNGVLTMSFFMCLILCTIGFLMYWILSIRERELLFGVYRAMGMTRKEIYWMLMIEQILSSVFCIVCGVICGFVTSYLFMDVFTIAYAPHKHLLEYVIRINWFDLTKLAITIVLMLIVCFVILIKQIKGLNIVHALKLGEE